MTIHRGDIVLVHYPFTSGTGAKTRPALVVQSDKNNCRLNNTIVVQITSRIHLTHSEPTQLLIQLASPAGVQSGLMHDSAVSCENLYTVHQNLILHKIGSLPTETMQLIDNCLKSSLGINEE